MSCKSAWKWAAAALVLPALAGCAAVDPGMGEALKYDMAIQTVDPDPVYAADDAQPGASGVHGAEAVKRYRKGEVKQIESIRTDSGSGASSGSGSNPGS